MGPFEYPHPVLRDETDMLASFPTRCSRVAGRDPFRSSEPHPTDEVVIALPGRAGRSHQRLPPRQNSGTRSESSSELPLDAAHRPDPVPPQRDQLVVALPGHTADHPGHIAGPRALHVPGPFAACGRAVDRRDRMVDPDPPHRPALRTRGRQVGLHRLGPRPSPTHPPPVPRTARVLTEHRRRPRRRHQRPTAPSAQPRPAPLNRDGDQTQPGYPVPAHTTTVRRATPAAQPSLRAGPPETTSP